ncbi:hypothetical protein [Ferrovibrio sp.]|uniref:hypothetical protein n=1 Tax=Ferrovibrio sp. TaxID=1917215 RepID=UPI000CBCF954|nr:hypothetical protein [Ferrovibrio sp.]PJI42159.1 MAG: hypothetical protein CTR53_06880 [Ferrovibrio sp.]
MYILILIILHTALSLVALATGPSVVADLLGSREREGMTKLFLATALLTSATGFLFPFTQLLPPHITALLALLVLAVTIPARYRYGLRGAWRWIYASGAVASLWLLVFVLIAQVFAKIPALRAAAPTQSEPPFAITQVVVLVVFIALGIAAARRFQPAVTPAIAG